MDEDPTEAAAPQAPPAEPQEAQNASSEDTTTLSVSGPMYVTHLNLPGSDGSSLVIDRAGISVPTTDVDRIMAAAAKAGVTLTRKAH